VSPLLTVRCRGVERRRGAQPSESLDEAWCRDGGHDNVGQFSEVDERKGIGGGLALHHGAYHMRAAHIWVEVWTSHGACARRGSVC